MSTVIPDEQLDFDPFAQSVDTTDMDADTARDSGSGNYVNAEGKFHVEVTFTEVHQADMSNRKLPHAKIAMRVLNGTDESQIDRTLNHFIWLAGWADKKTKTEMIPLEEKRLREILVLLHSFGVISTDDAFGRKKVTISRDMFDRLERTQAVVKVTKDRDWKKTNADGSTETVEGRHKIGWNTDTWPLGHAEVEDVPVDSEAAMMAGHVSGAATNSDIDDI
jgi:hypothetical protein